MRAVITMEAGWVVTEVGRQPWIVYNHMKVEDAVTANTGVWITFFAVVILYALVGTTTILVLRGMSKRFRKPAGFTDHDTPYGPSALTEVVGRGRRRGGRVSTAVAWCCCWPWSRTRSSGAPTLGRASGT